MNYLFWSEVNSLLGVREWMERNNTVKKAPFTSF